MGAVGAMVGRAVFAAAAAGVAVHIGGPGQGRCSYMGIAPIGSRGWVPVIGETEGGLSRQAVSVELHNTRTDKVLLRSAL